MERWTQKVKLCCSIFVPTLRSGYWPKERGCSYKRLELVSFTGRRRSWTSSGVEPLLHIERSRLRWFIWLGCLQVASLRRFFRLVLLGGGSGADPELTEGITYPLCPGNAPGIPQEELESVAGERKVWVPLLNLEAGDSRRMTSPIGDSKWLIWLMMSLKISLRATWFYSSWKYFFLYIWSSAPTNELNNKQKHVFVCVKALKIHILLRLYRQKSQLEKRIKAEKVTQFF